MSAEQNMAETHEISEPFTKLCLKLTVRDSAIERGELSRESLSEIHVSAPAQITQSCRLLHYVCSISEMVLDEY